MSNKAVENTVAAEDENQAFYSNKKGNKAVSTVALLLSKLGEVGHGIAALAVFGMGVTSAVNPEVAALVQQGIAQDGVGSYDFAFSVVPSVQASGAGIMVATITATLILLCMMMVFRNVNLSLRAAAGQTWFSKGETPFQEDVLRMVSEISIFLVVASVISIIGAAVLGLMDPQAFAEATGGISCLVFGIMVGCLGQVFQRGEELEADLDGLV